MFLELFGEMFLLLKKMMIFNIIQFYVYIYKLNNFINYKKKIYYLAQLIIYLMLLLKIINYKI